MLLLLIYIVLLLVGIFAPVALGAYLTREQPKRWFRTDRVQTAPIAGPPADYRSSGLVDSYALHVTEITIPVEAVRAAHVLHVSITVSFLGLLPAVGAVLEESGTWVPLGLAGLLFVALGAAQLPARRAVVRVQLARATLVRVVGWATVGFAALGLAAIALATVAALPAWWLPFALHDTGIVLAPLLLFPLFVGVRTLAAGAALRAAAEPRIRIDVSSESAPLLSEPAHDETEETPDEQSRLRRTP